MEEEYSRRPPGLRFVTGKPYWRASKAAVRKGYPVKSVNLSHLLDDRAIHDRCVRLQKEMDEWMTGGARTRAGFDGTFLSLLENYQTDRRSTYQSLKYASRKPYDSYLRMMKVEIGRCRIDRTDGRDLLDWFDAWAEPEKKGHPPRIARARMAMAVLKAAVTFGIMCRYRGCAEFRAVLNATTFPGLRSRTEIMSAAQVTAARAAARAAGHAPAALAYAIQFEGALRQWDVIGQWLPISEPQPSAVIRNGRKWIGPSWMQVDENLVLRVRPTKTETTTGREVVIDFRACPMVMEELQAIPQEARIGPLIVNPKTGAPYTNEDFRDLWRGVAEAAGIPPSVWNRDLRKSGSTEARAAGAPIDDLKKMMGHAAASRTTSKVYDRAHLEAHRRIAAARNSHRDKK
jgi:hypothetical protein